MPVEQHPVPQHISSYEFRLVGDMTLRQFGYLAGGVVIALIFYSLPLPGFIKWPLVALPAFLGFAFAFLPIEERPLSVWLVAFIKSVYSPTLFTWQKTAQRPSFFDPIKTSQLAAVKSPIIPADKTQLNQYLKNLNQPAGKIDSDENNFLSQISNLFQTMPTAEPIEPAITPPLPTPVGEKPVFSIPQYQPPVKEEVPLEPETAKPKIPPKYPSIFGPVVIPTQADYQKGPVMAAKMGIDLPIPIQPTRPNILSGMVFDKYGKMLADAIIEIRDQQGMPVRAFKSNKLGQFIIATALEKGVYEIEIEKEGYQFDIIKIEAKGEIIKPIEIRSKN